VPLPEDGIQRFKKIVLSYVELKTNLDFRNDPVVPHKGIFISNDFQVAGVPVTPNFRGPNVLFPYDVKVQPEIRGYIPIRRSTLAMRLTVGFLFPADYGDSFASGAPTLDADDSQQIFFRGFFSGGPNSNRGYPFRGVGSKGPLPFFIPGISPTMSPNAAADCAARPDLANSLGCNFPTGGLSLWETSVELRVPLAGEFGGAVFCDASDVSRYRVNIRVLYPHLSCGVGAHYNTPVGPVRLDFGVQIPKMQVLDPEATEADKASYSWYAVSVGIGEAF
jgi:outer membrane protein insertion porin family/translocation and assembly module TamA